MQRDEIEMRNKQIKIKTKQKKTNRQRRGKKTRIEKVEIIG